ncbi:hypothetical protein D3C72_1224060 [compost metagenome]
MKRWIVPVTTISVILGSLVAVQYKSQLNSRQLSPSRRVEDLVFMLKSTEKANRQLADQVTQLQERLKQTQAGTAPPEHSPALGNLADTAATYPAMVGPGLAVSLQESGAENKLEEGAAAVVHAEDLLKIVNELRAGGAEAVALNGHRLTEVSEVVTAGQHIMVNGEAIKAPYQIAAIGPAKEMKTTLALRGGVSEYLQFYGIEVKAQFEKNLEVPAAEKLTEFRFAKPVPPKT